MVRITIGGKGDQFCVYMCVASQRQLSFFQHKDASSLRHHKAVPVKVIWT